MTTTIPDLTAIQWQIYVTPKPLPGWKRCVRDLNQALNQALTEYYLRVDLGMTPREAMEYAVNKKLRPVMMRHRHHGAYDTEPCIVATVALNEATGNEFDRHEIF